MSRYDGNNDVKRNVRLTPEYIIRALGPFDLDPCGQPAFIRPYEIATETYTEEMDGMKQHWDRDKMIWLNPPYMRQKGYKLYDWTKKLRDHNNGFLIIPPNSDTAYWHDLILPNAMSKLEVRGRINFPNALGVVDKNDSNQQPSVIFSFGEKAFLRLLKQNRIPGTLQILNR